MDTQTQLHKHSSPHTAEAQSEEQQSRRYLGIRGLHSLLKQFLLMDRDRIGAIKRADFSDLLTHSSLMAGCTQRYVGGMVLCLIAE